jgi:hypothetical protein
VLLLAHKNLEKRIRWRTETYPSRNGFTRFALESPSRRHKRVADSNSSEYSPCAGGLNRRSNKGFTAINQSIESEVHQLAFADGVARLR